MKHEPNPYALLSIKQRPKRPPTTEEERAEFYRKKAAGELPPRPATKMAPLLLVTDGGSVYQTGKGGWGYAIVQNGQLIHEQYDAVEATTNNRMEVHAVMEGLLHIYERWGMDSVVKVRSDSQYAIGCLTKKKKGWKYNGNANLDLLDDARTVILSSIGSITFEWVRGHSGECPWHERVDKLVGKAYNGGPMRKPIRIKGKRAMKGKLK
jgi:ribonuclease HI